MSNQSYLKQIVAKLTALPNWECEIRELLEREYWDVVEDIAFARGEN